MGSVKAASLNLKDYAKAFEELSKEADGASAVFNSFESALKQVRNEMAQSKLAAFKKELKEALVAEEQNLKAQKELAKYLANRSTFQAAAAGISSLTKKMAEFGIKTISSSKAVKGLAAAMRVANMVGGMVSGVAGIGGAVKDGVSSVGSAIVSTFEGSLGNSYTAKQANTNARRMKAFKQAAELSGYSSVLDENWLTQMRDKITSFDNAGALAFLGLNQEDLVKKDGVSSAMEIIKAMSKFTNGNVMTEKALAQGVDLESFLGMNYSQMKAMNFKELNSNLNERLGSLIYDENKRNSAEKAYMNLGYAWEDMKGAALEKLMPIFTEAVKQLKVVFDKLSKYLAANGVMDKLAKGLAQWVASLDIGKLVDALTNTLPKIFNGIIYVLAKVGSVVLPDSAGGKELRQIASDMQFSNLSTKEQVSASFKNIHLGLQFNKKSKALNEDASHLDRLKRQNVLNAEEFKHVENEVKSLRSSYLEKQVDVAIIPKVITENGKKVLEINIGTDRSVGTMRHNITQTGLTAKGGS